MEALLPFRSAPPAFIQKVASGTTATSATNGTFTSIAFATNDLDNNLSVIENTSSTQLKALVAGTFRIAHNVSILVAVNNKSFESRLLKNGATALTQSRTTCACSNPTEGSLVQNILVDLAANDTIEVQVAPINATAGTAQANSQFCMELVKFN